MPCSVPPTGIDPLPVQLITKLSSRSSTDPSFVATSNRQARHQDQAVRKRMATVNPKRPDSHSEAIGGLLCGKVSP